MVGITTHWTPGRPAGRGPRWGLLLVAGVSALLLGWRRPEIPGTAPAQSAGAGQRLRFVIVAVNGEPQLVPAGAELAVHHGDQIEVRKAVLADPLGRPEALDVVGLKDEGKAGDRGRAFRTDDLLARHSEGGTGEVYAVVVASKRVRHGAVFLRLVPPELRWLSVSVNGVPRILRDGEAVRLRASDRFKVLEVGTNLPADSAGDVRLSVATVVPELPGGGRLAEFRVSRAGKVFARIPVTLVE